MIRVVLEQVAVFLIPFLFFAAVLLLRRQNLLAFEHWAAHVSWLAIAGLLLVLLGFIAAGIFAERPESGFEPTHMENGQVVPGRFR